jgi:flagellin
MLLNNSFLTLNNSTLNQKKLSQSLNKLSTSLEINKASDDASGLAIADKLRTQASGIKQGIENANSAIAMMNVADKSMDELSNILDNIKAKAIQMNTDTTSEEGRIIIKTEILKLIEAYDNIVCSTNYNTTPLLNGCASPFDFQVGEDSSNIVSVDINSVASKNMGLEDPNKLNNFITGFDSNPTVIPPETIGSSEDGIILSNDLDDRVSYSSNPAGNYMITIPSGTKNLTIHLDDHGANDTIQVFTKDGVHAAGTVSTDSSWSSGYSPEDIISLNSDKFNSGASYVNDLTRYTLNSPKDALGDTTVEYIDKEGETQTKVLNVNDEMIVISEVTEDLVIFINGNGSYDVGAEWKGTSEGTNTSEEDETCSCENLNLVRNDTNPDLKTQSQILMDVINSSLTQLNSQRANVGSGTNQLESSVRNSLTNYTNIKNAESIIRDVDYAKESANFNKLNIINQAGSFVQAQQNETMKRVLDLLK